jgi:hypothetical protein
MHLVGYDLQNRPIIYSCLALATNKDYLDNWHHMVQTFEMVSTDSRPCHGQGTEQQWSAVEVCGAC